MWTEMMIEEHNIKKEILESQATHEDVTGLLYKQCNGHWWVLKMVRLSVGNIYMYPVWSKCEDKSVTSSLQPIKQ